jgi:ferredoxin
VLTWIHYRGLLVIALLVAGNVFCMGCPMVRVRDWGRRLHAPTRRWPRVLRTKWMALALFVAVLVAYEWFDLWALPRATAALVLAYFGAALLVDLVFSGATFCKYLCPVGQFNFAASTMSPLEMRVRQPEVCGTCRTYDCIKGRPPAATPPQRGCELGLFLPAKVGNLDCTFCLDCAHACPHDNIALAPRVPGAELIESGRRSAIGRLSRRPDLAALAVVFTFGGLVNAFAMTSPIQHLHHRLGWSDGAMLSAIFVAFLAAAPFVLLGTAAGLSRWLANEPRGSVWRTAVRYAYTLIPLGFGIWLAHYGFHFLTGALSIVPAVQRAASDLAGWALLGVPQGQWTGLAPSVVLPMELGVVVLGVIGSLALVHGIARGESVATPRLAAAPWTTVVILLGAVALWLFAQPMDMRGMNMEMGAGDGKGSWAMDARGARLP